MPERHRIRIVGGGFCGTMVLWHLMQRDDVPLLDIAFYDEHGRHGRGVAYSTPYREHLLNVPAGGMSAVPHDPDHFLRWLGAGADKAKFYPRIVYGDYLSSLLSDAQEIARQKGHRITLHSERAPSDYDGLTVFATGTSQPLWPGGVRPADPRLVDNPYVPYAVPPGSETVLILGTGLSAVDAIMTLHHGSYAGEIVCVSRRGLWPVPHGPKSRPWHWRKYIDALRPHSNLIWRSLPESVRVLFLRKITYWNIIRHRMPRECFDILQRLRGEGRLRTMRGAISGIENSSSGLIVQTTNTTLRGDLVINCLGFIPYNQAPASSHSLDNRTWILGAPLFGHLIETTAVPELKFQAAQVSNNVLAKLI